MNTIVRKIGTQDVDEQSFVDVIGEAAMLIRSGGLVAFPTETVYGLGANALDEVACAGIFVAKQRPADNPLIIHISDVSMMNDLCEVSAEAQKLMEVFWPGALTIIMPKKDKVPDIVSAGLKTVAIRLPANPIARALIKASNAPIAAPSANLSGSPSPTQAEHVVEDFDGKIPLIIDGGAVDIGLESTVVDATSDKVMILRPGAISAENLADVLGYEVEYAKIDENKNEKPKSPGMKHKHYSPKANLQLASSIEEVEKFRNEVLSEKGEEPLCIIMEKEGQAFGSEMEILKIAKYGDLETYARNLFATLRYADSQNYKSIIIQTVPEKRMGVAIMNRLKRAALQ